MISCLILGSGPAGYTAAIYAGRSGLQPVIYEGLQPGGQLTITTEIENYPGFPEGIDANEMMDDMRKQALRFGTEIRPASAVKVDLSQAPYKVWFDDDTMEECQTLIIATGAGAGARHSMGTGVFGGMLAATFVSTIFVPVFFTWFAKKSSKKR